MPVAQSSTTSRFLAPIASITVVLGPNGAGKTTTIETAEGFRSPHGGSVRVLGLDPQAQTRVLSPRVGVMLQSGGVWPALRAADMLTHVSRLYAHPLPPQALMERLGLTHVARTPYRRLSGGEQQKLALACALVGRPEVTFLDEPTTGLDPESRIGVWQFLAELRDSGVGVVMSTHLLDEAQSLADHVIVIDQGRLAASGSVAELTGGHARAAFPLPGRDGCRRPDRPAAGRVLRDRVQPRPVPGGRPGHPADRGVGDVVVRRAGGDARGAQHRGRVPVRGLLRDHLTGRSGRGDDRRGDHDSGQAGAAHEHTDPRPDPGAGRCPHEWRGGGRSRGSSGGSS